MIGLNRFYWTAHWTAQGGGNAGLFGFSPISPISPMSLNHSSKWRLRGLGNHNHSTGQAQNLTAIFPSGLTGLTGLTLKSLCYTASAIGLPIWTVWTAVHHGHSNSAHRMMAGIQTHRVLRSNSFCCSRRSSFVVVAMCDMTAIATSAPSPSNRLMLVPPSAGEPNTFHYGNSTPSARVLPPAPRLRVAQSATFQSAQRNYEGFRRYG